MIRVGSNKVLPYEKKLIQKVLNSNQISPDRYCKQFEDEFSKIHQVKYSAFVSSGTDALRIALLALKEKNGWNDGDEVLVPGITFVATLNVVLQVGLKPVIVDIGLNDYMMNSARLTPSELRYMGERDGEKVFEREVNMAGFIGSKTKCMIVAHLFGQPADMDPLLEAAKYHNLKVVEDSCETMFVKYKGRSVGSFGDVSCFSTYACHLLSTGVGGFCCTSDPELATLIRSYANHGRDPAYIPGYSKPASIAEFVDKHFKYDRIGYSSRGTELQACLGLGQLRVHKQLVKKRQVNAIAITDALSHLEDKLRLPYPCWDREHAWMMYPIMLNEKYSKRKLMIHLMNNGIEARDLMPITNQPCYKPYPSIYGRDWSETAKANKHGFYIGCHPEITPGEIQKIKRVFSSFFSERT